MQFIGENDMILPPSAEINIPTLQFQVVDVPLANVYEELRTAPEEFVQSIRQSATTILLPLPNGHWRSFRGGESSVMPPELQARWPQLRTYRILDVENPNFSGRFTLTPQGVTAIYNSEKGEVLLEPYASGQARYHAVYYSRNVDAWPENTAPLACGYEPDGASYFQPPKVITSSNDLEKSGDAAQIHEFVMALTCTGEYAQQKGGTVEAVLSTFVTSIYIANATFEREVGVRIRLLANQEALIFLNPGTDPFINADEGRELLPQVGPALQAAGVPEVGYDLGHVFTSACTDVGGVVGGQACTSGKDEGVTCHFTNNITRIILEIFTHEIAHQFAVDHSWSNCPGNQGQVATGSAFEPGSGSTIMSYAGVCNSGQNVAGTNDDYYHGHSLEQFIFFSREGQGSGCASVLPTDNTEPELTLDYTDDFYIPISTPFELKATATDEDGDNITYCWEQIDLGPMSALGTPSGDTPLFRSYPPNGTSNRVFPRLPVLVNNASENTEVLPTYGRALTFRCSVRDNNPEIGATVWEDVAFRSDASAGPFVVMSPSNGSEEWKVGEYREVTWDVANTNNDIVDCRLVNIRLSTDGGFTYPHMLLERTPNNGSAFVTVPDLLGSEMRIRVEAADNIFFDISNNDFRIEPAEEATYTMSYDPAFQLVCLPGTAEITFNTGTVLGYDGTLNLSLSSELPENVTASFSDEEIAPGESTSLIVDFSNFTDYDGPLQIQVATAAPGLETVIRDIYFDIVDNDFSGIELLTPLAGEAGIGLETDFSWTSVPNALMYDWELSDDPGFEDILASSYGMTGTALSPEIQLAANTLFYWRVRGVNECGNAPWQQTRVFHTVNVLCSPISSEDTPLTIPGVGPLPTIESEVFVPFSGVISDVNVPSINVRYQPIQNFYVSLVSPEQTEVRLYDQTCFGTDQVRIGFDDEAPLEIICPPDDAILFQPAEPLSAFIGENSQGTWKLRVKVLETGFGAPGQLGN